MSTATAGSALIVRELPPEEWWKLKPHSPNGQLPNPGHCRVVVAEDDEGLVRGFWFTFAAIHVEPLWIDENYRERSGSLVRRLWGGIRGILDSMREGTGGLFGNVAFAVINDEDLPRKLPMARRLGFTKVPGSLYFVVPENGDSEALPEVKE